MAMDPLIKQMWVDALRSGDYKQGTRRLHYLDSAGEERFCCLGVLCDLAVKNGVSVEVHVNEFDSTKMPGTRRRKWYYDDDCVRLPQDVIEWTGHTTLNASEVMNELIILNDAVRKPFDQIAKFIDENF
jgi:hypothetical protein